MRRKVEENFGALGATTVALIFVLVYSFWGMTILHNEQVNRAAVGQQQNLAVK